MNPEDKFDLEVVNSVNMRAVLEQARGDKRILHQVVRAAEALLPRVRAETEDPILVSGILREKTLDWFRRSPTDRTWTETAPLRWGGMFQESRVPLERLSALARRNGTTEVNITLTELFPQETANLLTVIDPRFHLGMSALSLRIVPARNQEDGATYDLVQASARSSRKSTNTYAANVDADPTSPWEREGITQKDWALLLRDLSKRKGKLDP